ncbi:MAG: sigma factor-like helix-turn-helix DNA-binding protein, partial [Pseudomonadota bacterium]
KAKEKLGWFSADEVNQVAKDLNVKPAEVREMESRLGQVDTSFDMTVSDDEENFSASPALYLSGDEAEDPAWVVADEEVTDIQNAGLVTAIESLDDRARDIIESRWLSEDKAGLKELSEKYGVSMERIRQIEAAAIKKLKGAMV